MEERAKIAPGLPREQPTVPYWSLIHTSHLAHFRSSPDLPTHVDSVVIGSGISGSSIAHNVLSTRPEASVVLLEARGAVSGATGRNGGHTKAASYRNFLDHERRYGTEEAINIARLEFENMKRTHELARELGIDCASRPCDSVDIIYSQHQLEMGKKAINRMVEMMGADDSAARYDVWTAAQAQERFLSPNALGAFSYPAGSISGYQFTLGILKLALEKGLHLQTDTPVLSIEHNATANKWLAQTPRGTVTASNLILATNGYTAHLLPEMQGLIVPMHGQVVAQRPGTGLSPQGLPTTYSYIVETGYDYMISRPPGTTNAGDIIIGGGIHQLPDDGASRFGNTDDTSLDPTITDYLRRCTADFFGSKWGDDHPEGRIRHEWSGIMGASADGLPYVGPIPNRPQGLWMCASFNGHGMVWCLKAAEALVAMMLGDDASAHKVNQWFPSAARLTEGRMQMKFRGGDWQAHGDDQD